MGFQIVVVGMGLMGASLARSLIGFRDARIVGVDHSRAVCEKAVEQGYVQECFEEITQAVPGSDLILFCTYASQVPALLERCLPLLKKGVVLGDICGVKGTLYPKILPLLDSSVQYVGMHPMTGKAQDGIENAAAGLYKGAGCILCPTSHSSEESLALMEEMADYIGCEPIQKVPPEIHDEVIGYTSDLMHIAAAGLCLRYPDQLTPSFTGGSFRDCTRVADVNPRAWSEILLDNRAFVLKWLQGYIEDLTDFQQSIESQDQEALMALLQKAGDNKRKMGEHNGKTKG